MSLKLVQKHLIKGSQEFEIVDDMLNIRIKSPLKKEELLTVMLTVLNPEPVIGRKTLEFTSRVNNEALVSMYLAKPNAAEFNAFVNEIKQRIQDEFSAFAGLKSSSANAMSQNVHEEPPEFDTISEADKQKMIIPERVRETADLLRLNMNEEDIKPLLDALKALAESPEDTKTLNEFIDSFHALGPMQGAVLTYGPYVSVILADDPMGGF